MKVRRTFDRLDQSYLNGLVARAKQGSSNAFAELFLVPAALLDLGVSAYFLGQIYVFDIDKSQIGIVIKRFCAYHLFFIKKLMLLCIANAGIKRPLFIFELVFNIPQKIHGFKTTIVPATVLTMFQIYFVTYISFITGYCSVIEKYSSSLDFINNGIVRSIQMFCYFVWRPFILQSNLYFVTFF